MNTFVSTLRLHRDNDYESLLPLSQTSCNDPPPTSSECYDPMPKPTAFSHLRPGKNPLLFHCLSPLVSQQLSKVRKIESLKYGDSIEAIVQRQQRLGMMAPSTVLNSNETSPLRPLITKAQGFRTRNAVSEMNHYSDMAVNRHKSDLSLLSDLQIQKKKLSLAPINSELVRESNTPDLPFEQFTQFQMQIEKDN